MQRRRSWVISETKAGTITQCLGVASAFDTCPAQRIVDYLPRWKRLFKPPLFQASEPEPSLLVSCGMRSEKPAMAMKDAYCGRPLAVHLQRPKADGYDLAFVSRHDWLPEFDDLANYHQVVGVVHRINREDLGRRRSAARKRLAPDDDKIAAVFVGGSNGAYLYDEQALASIRSAVHCLADQGWKVLVSTSRRSSSQTLAEMLTLSSERVSVWDRLSENPYLDYLAAADAYLIAKDSVTMPCEALATGRPVYSLDLTHLAGKREMKFERFHDDLQRVLKLTRPFAGTLDAYDYVPLDETSRIVNIVDKELSARGL